MAATVSEQLREAIEGYGSVYRVAKDSGIPQSTLQRFAAGDRGLSMESIDRLAAFFEMHLTRPKRRRPK